MNQPERQPKHEINQNAPTTLQLFRYKGVELTNLKTRVSSASRLEHHLSLIGASLNELMTGKNARVGRLDQSEEELSEQLNNTASSITCGAAYLKMSEELKGLSPKDFMEFFKLCLTINTNLSSFLIEQIKRGTEQAVLLHAISTINTLYTPPPIKILFDKAANNPPEWFRDNIESWSNFIASHANFNVYLNYEVFTNLIPNKGGFIRKALDSSLLSGRTTKEEFPDWLLENNIAPTTQRVKEELAEDNEQEIKITEGLDKIEKQKIYLNDIVEQKAKRAATRVSELAKQLFLDPQNFTDLILLLRLIAKKSAIFPTESAEEDIQGIQNHPGLEDIVTCKESIALYIEKKLKEGTIITSAQDIIGNNFIDLFILALKSIQAQERNDPTTDRFQILKTTNKKAFGALNYDLKPFLEIAPSSELSFLEELLEDSSGQPVEQFIWDVAELISSRFKEKRNLVLSKSQLGAIHYLKKFITSFLRNHSEWAYGEIKHGVFGEELSTANVRDQKTQEQTEVEVNELQEELDNTRGEIVQGNLAGWNIFYTDNKTSDEKHLIEVKGATPEERESALQQLFLRENVPSSIKPGSIVRAFEWLVSVPEKVEQVRIRKDIDGEVFKKLKRGGLRIFYIMDIAKKSIVFFTHQKKSFSYGF